jgi:hypothetical protein
VSERPEGETGAAAADTTGAAPVEWRFDPWRERPRAAALGVGASLGMAALVLAMGEHPLITAVLALVGAAALSPVFTPARCRLDDDGAARRGPWGWERRAWAEIRRALLGPGGLMVSPFARPSWLDPYRGLVLPLPRGDARVRAAVAAQLASHGF